MSPRSRRTLNSGKKLKTGIDKLTIIYLSFPSSFDFHFLSFFIQKFNIIFFVFYSWFIDDQMISIFDFMYEGNPFIFVFWGTFGVCSRGLLEFS